MDEAVLVFEAGCLAVGQRAEPTLRAREHSHVSENNDDASYPLRSWRTNDPP